MIKVLHLLPMNKLSGAERMGLLICKHMSEVESYVITGGADLAAVFEKEGIQTSHLNFSIKQLPQVIKQLNQFIKEKQIDIVHAHDNIASLSAYLTKKRYGLTVKVVSHIHSCYPWLEGNGLYKRIDCWVRPRYDFNIVCGKFVYDYYNQHAIYFNKEKMIILSNAINTSQLGAIPKYQIDEIRKEFNIPSDQTIIGYIGRLVELKGLVPFIKTLDKYKQQFNNCKFLIVGDGDQEDEIKQLIKDLKLEDLFVFTGFQSNVYPFYQLIDIFFLPSLYEGLPMVLLEAVGSGVPTISMNVGSISEVIERDYNGVLIEKGDYATFVQQLVKMKEDPNSLNIYKENGKKKIASYFDIGVYNQQLKDVYSQLVK